MITSSGTKQDLGYHSFNLRLRKVLLKEFHDMWRCSRWGYGDEGGCSGQPDIAGWSLCGERIKGPEASQTGKRPSCIPAHGRRRRHEQALNLLLEFLKIPGCGEATGCGGDFAIVLPEQPATRWVAQVRVGWRDPPVFHSLSEGKSGGASQGVAFEVRQLEDYIKFLGASDLTHESDGGFVCLP